MTPFAKLPCGTIFETRTGRWRKIFPTPNTNRRQLPPWNALLIDPPVIHPNLWKQAERLRSSPKEKDQSEGNTLALELNTLAIAPVHGTFLDGFLVTQVEDTASAPALSSPCQSNDCDPMSGTVPLHTAEKVPDFNKERITT